jgi:hypothetical protein
MSSDMQNVADFRHFLAAGDRDGAKTETQRKRTGLHKNNKKVVGFSLR